MSEITLSAGVRSNLLSLQNTAKLMNQTQTRLATGKKVNSALDNPTNFFTASSLHARSNDLSALLDSMSNGIKTLEAADNGLKAITKTVETMQATLRQARQDKSFQTSSFGINLGATPAGTEELSFAGGAVGTTPVSVGLTTTSGGTGPSAAALTAGTFSAVDLSGTQDQNAALAGADPLSNIDLSHENAVASGTSALSTVDASGGDITFEINGQTVTLADNGGPGSDGLWTAQSIVDAINTQVGGSANVVASLGTGGELVLTSTDTAGSGDTITVDTFNTGDATQLGFGSASVSETGSDTADLTFDVNGETVTLAGGSDYSATDIRDAINTQVGASASVNATIGGSGELVITSTATAGSSDSVTVDNFSAGDASQLGYAAQASVSDSGSDGVAASITFDLNVNGAGAQTITLDNSITANDLTAVTAQEIAAAINAEFGSTVASVNGDGDLVFTSSTTGTSSTVEISNFAAAGGATGSGIANASATGSAASGGTTVAKSVDDLVNEINANSDLVGRVRASNDNGQLRIQNLSTQDLTLTGISGSGQVDGGTGTSDISGNSVRGGLARQFNELRDQLDKLADDASFNGINLLLGDNLRLTFNETGTSTIDIQVEGGNAINSAYLGLNTVADTDFDNDATIDGLLGGMKNALDTLRTQASAFGSNLSIVQNREEFTKSMMNTLQTGADNLILADTNEEGANMLALQTRQQLSSVALSLASQADQNVLRLF